VIGGAEHSARGCDDVGFDAIGSESEIDSSIFRRSGDGWRRLVVVVSWRRAWCGETAFQNGKEELLWGGFGDELD
jgi:hypothetical protein